MKTKLELADIKAKVRDVKYTVLEDGKTTIANVYLVNGFTVRGESACVDPANFNKKLGEEIALENAIDKIWELEGYLLTEEIYQSKDRDYKDRMIDEYADLKLKTLKLGSALSDRNFKSSIGAAKTSLLELQLTSMKMYSSILLQRIQLEGYSLDDKGNIYDEDKLVYSEEISSDFELSDI